MRRGRLVVVAANVRANTCAQVSLEVNRNAPGRVSGPGFCVLGRGPVIELAEGPTNGERERG